jgi:hypothetical protein
MRRLHWDEASLDLRPGVARGTRARHHRAMPEPALVLPTMDAIRRWQGIGPPGPAARLALADLDALIAELAALRDLLAFEAEPADFDRALRDCREP